MYQITKLSVLKQHPFIISQFCRSETCSESYRAEYSVSWTGFSSRGSGKESALSSLSWQNSVTCFYKTKVPVFLLAVGQGLLSAPRGNPTPCHAVPSTFQPPTERRLLFRLGFSLTSSSTTSQRHCFARAPVIT